MALPFHFQHQIDFQPEQAEATLRQVPAVPGVVALFGADPAAAPYLTRAADLRRRLRRLLAPPVELDAAGQPVASRRLNLSGRVRRLAYTTTGSQFESNLLLYHASCALFGPEQARRRLHLHAPAFLRITLSAPHPRLYATQRLSRRALAETFGPFASRAAAERYADAVLDLFLLRRCHEDLHPYPEHPGCVYGEMHKCLMPCKEGNPAACTPAGYAAEAQRVFAFLRTGGQSLLDEVAAEREAASAALEFELAAALHQRWERVRAAALLADELVRPVDELRALVLQRAATESESPDADREDAAVFLLEHGQLVGPARLSTRGVRAVREQTAVGSSLFAQPLMLAPVPLNPVPLDAADAPAAAAATTPEDRARATLAQLQTDAREPAELPELCDALALFRRWYYRPEKQRTGEVFLPLADGSWPLRRILNGAARVVLGPPTEAPAVDRDAARTLKTKVAHKGREGVEKLVPVLPKRNVHPGGTT